MLKSFKKYMRAIPTSNSAGENHRVLFLIFQFFARKGEPFYYLCIYEQNPKLLEKMIKIATEKLYIDWDLENIDQEKRKEVEYYFLRMIEAVILRWAQVGKCKMIGCAKYIRRIEKIIREAHSLCVRG